MAKKIFDILPPKAIYQEENIAEPAVAQVPQTKLKKRNPLKGFLFVFGIMMVISAGFLYFKLQKVNVEIWPKTEVLNFQEKIMADISAENVDLENKKIPVYFFQEEKDLWQEFQATGSAAQDGKASGQIVIYNNYKPASDITLKEGTHFLSDSGEYFVTLKRVVIPAAGSIQVNIQAKESGEDYNIKPSKFSVPKLVGTPYYYSVYAESMRDMEGGFSTTAKKVTEEDLKIAKNILQKNLLSNIKEAIKNKINSEYVVFDEAISTEITESSTAVKEGAVMDNFNYSAKAKAKALAFKKSDLENLIKEYIRASISAPKTYLEDSLVFDYNPESIEIENKKMALSVGFSVKSYQSVDRDDLVSLFRDKSAYEIKEIIGNRMGAGVSRIQINLWPFWTKSAPQDKDKIKLDLNFSEY